MFNGSNIVLYAIMFYSVMRILCKDTGNYNVDDT